MKKKFISVSFKTAGENLSENNNFVVKNLKTGTY